MKQTLIALATATLLTTTAFGEPTAIWHFNDGQAGETASTVANAINAQTLQGQAGSYGKGTLPAYAADAPAQEIWDGGNYTLACPQNTLSLQFVNEPQGTLSPFGGDVSISGADPATHAPNLTVEAFVKVNRQMPHHVLLASKRRDGQSGATWSLSIDPAGQVRVRFDTQTADDPDRKGFNRTIPATGNITDGQWHHVAFTFDHEQQAAVIYIDYQKCGGGTTTGPLVYDDSDIVLGRGLDGWLDEVRLSAAVLHPEQFLRRTQFFSELKKKVSQPTFLDQTHTRVQSALSPDLVRIGTLIPKSIDDIETPMWSLGCETLDRSLADWDAYKGYLRPLGIKRIRLQGGWNRTETKKGEYDFAWLDQIVDDAIKRGLIVCLETSYNNRLYEPGGATGPGGQLPDGEETLAAWDRWVEAMVQRYSAKGVKEWMMYNEPNLNKANTVERIVANNIRTAEIIKRVDPEAKIGAFVLAGLKVDLLEALLTQIKEQGKLDLFQWAIYHGYSGNPDRLNASMDELNAMLQRLAPNVRPWQGEAGCASEEVQYALSGIAWTEYSHAKWNARRMLCDFGHDIDSSVFTISDLSYHKDFISRYGLLKTNPDNSIIKVKDAYYTVQNVVSFFNAALTRIPDYPLTIAGTDKELIWFAFRDRESGLDAVTIWDGTEVPSNASDIELVDLEIADGSFETPVWIDIVTGNVYEIPAEQMARDGKIVRFMNIPVYDGPGVLTDRSLLTIEPARTKKKTAAKKPKTAPETAQTPEDLKLQKYLLPGTQQPAPAVLILAAGDAAVAEMPQWFNRQDVHAFVLETVNDNDVNAALALLRSRAAEWQIKGDAVGVLTFGTDSDSITKGVGKQADFVILIAAQPGDVSPPPADAKPPIFIGTKDAWKEPLTKWLDKRKGSVF